MPRKTKSRSQKAPSGRQRPRRRAQASSSSLSSMRSVPTAFGNTGKTGQLSVSGSHDRLRVRGREFIQTIVVQSDNIAGTVVCRLPNLAGPPNTRLSQFASIYERWRPFRYSYRYVPSVPTTTAGSLIFANEPDVYQSYDANIAANVSRLATLTGHSMVQNWQPAMCGLSSFSDYTSLWTQPATSGSDFDFDNRLSTAGQFVVCVLTPSALAAGTAYGSIELEYDIEFFRPQFNISVGESTETVARAPPGILNPLEGSPQFIFDRVMAFYKDLPRFPTSTLDTAAIRSVVDEYKKYTSPTPLVVCQSDSSSTSRSFSSSYYPSLPGGPSVTSGILYPGNDEGMAKGVYTLEFWVGYNAGSFSPYSLIKCDAVSSANTQFVTGTNRSVLKHQSNGDPSLAMYLPWGSIRDTVEVFTSQVSILNARSHGHWDTQLRWNQSAAVIDDLVNENQFECGYVVRWKGASTYINFNDVLPHSCERSVPKALTIPKESKESKEEARPLSLPSSLTGSLPAPKPVGPPAVLRRTS